MIEWHGDLAEQIAKQAGMKAIRDFAEQILTDAIDLTPHDTGTLRRSGTVTVGNMPSAESTFQSAEAGSQVKYDNPLGQEQAVYISFSTPYAIKQHEDLALSHTDGQAKYLESAFNQRQGQLKGYVDQQIKQALESR